MSSILTVYGTLRFPPAALERWRRLPLHHDPPPDGDALFDQPCDEATVAAVLACDDIADPILQVIADDELRVRAVLDDHSPLATRNEWTMRLSDVAFLLCVSGMTPEHCRDSLVRQNCYSDAEVREAEAALAGLGLLEKARKSA